MTTAHTPFAYAGPDHPRWRQTLSDGSQVVIRPIDRRDADAERAFIQALSADSRRMCFLGQISCPSDELIDSFTDIDYVNDVALAAVATEDGRERIVGVSRYAVDTTGQRCECAIVVADEWQHRGLGTALMERLIEIARGRGLRRMESVDLAENAEMRDLARFLGFDRRADPNDPRQVVYTMSLEGE